MRLGETNRNRNEVRVKDMNAGHKELNRSRIGEEDTKSRRELFSWGIYWPSLPTIAADSL